MTPGTTDTTAAAAPPGGSVRAPERTMRVWDLAVRVFHWCLATSFAGAYVSAESERLRTVHVWLGYAVAALIAFRLVWGLIGTRYARFSSFAFGWRAVRDYIVSLARAKPQHFLGHNPAGSWVIYALLLLAALASASGYATYNGVGGEWLEEIHESIASLMLIVVAVHVAGALVSSVVHRENLVRAMFDGKKREL